LDITWNDIWKANQDVFIMSGFEECTEEKRKSWRLSSHFSYFSTGDINLRVGIIACRNEYRDEDFLFEGISWGNYIGNGVRTVLYFVAQNFSPVFINAIAKLGGNISAKAVYWREKLTPSLYPVQETEYLNPSLIPDIFLPRPDWSFWQKQLNPVAWNQLQVIKEFFKGLEKRRVRTVFEKNKIIFRWGPFDIAEVTLKNNKFELSSKVKWTRNKNIVAKFLKTGWVDYAGNLNEEFRRSILGIIELLENMEAGRCFDNKDLLALKIITDREFLPKHFGSYLEYPWLIKNRKSILNNANLFYFFTSSQINVLHPIINKTILKMVQTLLISSFFELWDRKKKTYAESSNRKLKHKTVILSTSNLIDELRLCQCWLQDPQCFPIYIIPDDWKTEGLKDTKEMLPLNDAGFI